MKRFSAIYMAASSYYDPTKAWFKSAEEAWEYVKSSRCEMCVEFNENSCDYEWEVEKEGFLESLRTLYYKHKHNISVWIKYELLKLKRY